MQMIAEIYGMMRDGLGMEPEEVGGGLRGWNEGPLKSYLIEITGKVARAIDPETGRPMLDIILDSAGQKGTGRWTAIEALMLGAPATPSRRRWPRATSRRGSRSARRRAARFGAPERRVRRPTAAARPAGGGAARRQDRLLRPGLRRCSPPRRASSAGRCRWRGSPGSGAPAASSARRCSTTWPRRSSDGPRLNLMFAPRFAEMLTAANSSLRAVVAQAALPGIPTPALSRGPRLLRHDAHPPLHRQPAAGASGTSSAPTASSASTGPAPSTAPGAATRRSRPRGGLPDKNATCDLDHRGRPQFGGMILSSARLPGWRERKT